MKPCPSLFYLCGPYFVVLTSVRRCWSLILTGPDIYYSTKGSYFFFAFFVFLFCFCFFTCLLQAGTYLSVRTLSPSLKKNKGLDGIRTHTSQILINRDHIISQSKGIISPSYLTPPMLGQSITNWRCNTHTIILLGQSGILCSLYWRHFLKSVQ